MLKIFKSWLLYIMFVWILACQGLFILIQSSFADKVIESLQSQLRQELSLSNFHFLARSITDYTVSGNLRCGVLTKVFPMEMEIIDLRYMEKECNARSWALNGVQLDVELSSLNGDIYRFQFISENPTLFYLALWGFRVLGLMAIIGIALAMKYMTQAQIEVANRVRGLALQVSHDIRSPLSALMMTFKDREFENIDEKKLILGALERINDIANNLLQEEKERNRTIKQKPYLLNPIISSIVSEKKSQFSNIDFEIRIESSINPFLTVYVDESRLKRVLSNIINNSVEAFSDRGIVVISLLEDSESVLINIKDNGKGIHHEILDQVGKRGFTSKSSLKDSGTGLGLSSAFEIIKSFDGELMLNSNLGEGVEVKIRLPLSLPPQWLVKDINLNILDEVWVLDNDVSIHGIWKNRICSKTYFFRNANGLKQSLRNADEQKRRLFLIDFDLGSEQSGLELIFELGIMNSSMLVTSSSDNADIQARLIENKIGMIPKDLIHEISITNSVLDIFEYVFIDDDKIIRMGWELQAQKKGIKLLVLESTDDFYKYSNQISKDVTSIFIDSNFHDTSIRGEEFALKLHMDGYKYLSLATGYNKEEFSSMPWLKVCGKSCPF